jgi:CysZ protein
MLKKFGIYYLLYGIKMLRFKEIRSYVLIPLIVNILIFAFATAYVWHKASELAEYIEFELPDWLAFCQYLIIPLALLVFMVIAYYMFATVAGILAAPFNGALAGKADEIIQQRKLRDEPVSATLKDVPRIIAHTLRVLLYTLPRMLLSFLLLLIPVVGYIAWLAFSGWNVAVGYLDCAGDNHHKSLRELILSMRENRVACIGFGISVYFMMLVPFVNMIIIPAAVCGSTKLLADLDGGAITGDKEIFEPVQEEKEESDRTEELQTEEQPTGEAD